MQFPWVKKPIGNLTQRVDTINPTPKIGGCKCQLTFKIFAHDLKGFGLDGDTTINEYSNISYVQ
jgi:hypothetical protein